ncbi:spore protein [Bacillus sp. LL01]|uniref:H-type small acid-soluble spore protein n=1 Tax=Bacillus sp. LL01 TaxID=1665556 RepID=UPI00064CF007|nr:H-type small acid-soluble spore protein [Bacillus sp. LL01]KMJ58775.1 spore protein [Bacillus sp. LL01]
MEERRVRQILSSPTMIDVTFEGTKVWIDSISEDGSTATVHLRGPGEERTQVSVSDLMEVGE